MFFERPGDGSSPSDSAGERAVLVNLVLERGEAIDQYEFEALVVSAGGEPAAFVTGRRTAPNAKTFVGSGKLEEIAAVVTCPIRIQSSRTIIFRSTPFPGRLPFSNRSRNNG